MRTLLKILLIASVSLAHANNPKFNESVTDVQIMQAITSSLQEAGTTKEPYIDVTKQPLTVSVGNSIENKEIHPVLRDGKVSEYTRSITAPTDDGYIVVMTISDGRYSGTLERGNDLSFNKNSLPEPQYGFYTSTALYEPEDGSYNIAINVSFGENANVDKAKSLSDNLLAKIINLIES